jgi:NDP-sugar pyrophosphorylase family protein
MNFICGYLYPYSLHTDDRMSKIQRSGDKVFTVNKYSKIYRKGVKVANTAEVSNNVYLGQQSKVEADCVIDKSTIGKHTIVGKNSTLRHCIILDDVKIAANSTF